MLDTAKSVTALVLLLALPVLAAASHSIEFEQNGLRYFLATEQDTYTMYEDVPIQFSVTNVSGEPMVVFHPCVGLGGIDFAIWDPIGPFHPEQDVIWFCCGCFTEAWIDTLDVGESYSRERVWEMWHMYAEQPIWRAGTHTLEGGISMATFPEYADLGHRLFLDFEVLEEPTGLPTDLRLHWGRIKTLYR